MSKEDPWHAYCLELSCQLTDYYQLFLKIIPTSFYDVFRRIPVARTVVGIHGSEQQEALAMLDKIPPNGVLMFDRGYPNFGLIKELTESYKGYFLMRCKVHKTFPVLYGFMDRNEAEAELWIDPSRNYLYTLPKEKRNQQTPIKCRAIRLEGRDGTLSVLLTNLLDRQEFPAQEVIDLYFRRWEVEDHYRNEKVVMEVEHFHATTQNGVLQELYAACIMTIITRTLMALSRELTDSKAVEPQFTHAINILAMETAILVPDQPEKSVDIFKELIEEIARVKYYRPKIKRPSQPRIIKKPISKWLRVKRKNRAKKKKAT